MSNNETNTKVKGFYHMQRGIFILVIVTWLTGILQFVGPMRTVYIGGLVLSAWFYLVVCIVIPLATCAYMVSCEKKRVAALNEKKPQ